MKETEFFTALLGITQPWYIEKVDLDDGHKRVDIYINHHKGLQFPCPKCEELSSIYDHTSERVFRHLDTCQMQTLEFLIHF